MVRVLIAALLLLAGAQGATATGNRNTLPGKLDARIERMAEGVLVRYDQPVRLSDCRITVNGAFMLDSQRIVSGYNFFEYAGFRDAEGAALSPATHGVDSILIRCLRPRMTSGSRRY